MLLSHRTSVNIRPEYSNIIGHMCYAASKLWNVCNYERRRYKELGLEKYPDWYYQKKIPAVILNIRASRINSRWSVNLHLHSCLKGGRGMLLSHKTSVKICPEYSNIIGHMCYAASKLWNVCNYERRHYKELGLEKYPDWYYQ